MFVQSKDEKKNDIAGMVVSVVIHGLLLFLFFFIFIFKAPNPPLPKFGEIRLGYDPNGFGESNEQINTPPSPEEQLTPIEPSSEPAPETEENVFTNPNGEITVKDTKNTERAKVKTNTSQTASNPNSVYDPNKPTNSKGGGNSTPGGVQGDPRGVLNGGGSGGIGLDMSGWAWDSAPDVKDISIEAGRVVLKVSVDEKGEILDVDIIESTINKSLANKYRLKVMNMTFSKTDGGIAPSKSEGRITFTIKSR